MCSRMLSSAVAMAAFVAMAASAYDAQAGWHHRYGGSAGSYGGSTGGSYGSDGGSYGSAGGSASDGGSHGGHRHGWRARRHGSDGGSSGGAYGSSGGSFGGSSGGSYGGSHGGSAGGVASFTPESAAKTEVPKDGVLLTVQVPAEARVFVNGKQTSSLGATRVFAAKGLTPGKKYDFVVKMQTTVDGKAVEQSKTVSLVVGERQLVALAGEPAADRPKAALASTAALPTKQ